MGSKAKFWYHTSDAEKWLFKRCREKTGEDWAEKIAAEVAELLELPHARVELAEADGERGCVCLDFAGHSDLIHGNELLWQWDQTYPKTQMYRVSAHTIENVLQVLKNPSIAPPAGTAQGMTAALIFAGYLALDALIGNGDRHHENWGLLRSGSRVTLAPTYDHASSLGREFGDDKPRSEWMRKAGGVADYARRARSALYGSPSERRPLSTHAAFHAAAKQIPNARETWVQRIERLSDDALRQIIQKVPSRRITPTASEFALELMRENRRALCTEPQTP